MDTCLTNDKYEKMSIPQYLKKMTRREFTTALEFVIDTRLKNYNYEKTSKLRSRTRIKELDQQLDKLKD